ncbi:hypothetical protein JMUB7536_27500 [Staphylococcus aureus]
MIDTIKVNNKTIEWLVVQRGFEIPSFNYCLLYTSDAADE